MFATRPFVLVYISTYQLQVEQPRMPKHLINDDFHSTWRVCWRFLFCFVYDVTKREHFATTCMKLIQSFMSTSIWWTRSFMFRSFSDLSRCKSQWSSWKVIWKASKKRYARFVTNNIDSQSIEWHFVNVYKHSGAKTAKCRLEIIFNNSILKFENVHKLSHLIERSFLCTILCTLSLKKLRLETDLLLTTIIEFSLIYYGQCFWDRN